MKKLINSIFICSLVSFSGLVNATVCSLGIPQLPLFTTFSVGAQLNAVMSNNPSVTTAIVNGAAVYNAPGMNSVNRISGGNGIVRSSDCPESNYYNIGAWSFLNGNIGPTLCSSEPTPPTGRIILAYTLPGTTRSMGINLTVPWSTDGSPASDEVDMQSVMSHEFGHILGLAHQTNGVCAASPDISCATYGDGKETMSYGPGGELCQRTLAPHDIETINTLY